MAADGGRALAIGREAAIKDEDRHIAPGVGVEFGRLVRASDGGRF